MLFFVVIVYDFFITFVRYKIIASATEGLVQQGIAKSGAEGILINFSVIFELRYFY